MEHYEDWGGRQQPLLRPPEPAEGFEMVVVESGQLALARVTGAFDAERAPQFLARLLPLIARCSRLVVDMRRVDYLDSDGVRALLRLQDAVATRRTDLRLVLLPGSRPSRTLRLLQLDTQFAVFATAQAAWDGRVETHAAD